MPLALSRTNHQHRYDLSGLVFSQMQQSHFHQELLIFGKSFHIVRRFSCLFVIMNLLLISHWTQPIRSFRLTGILRKRLQQTTSIHSYVRPNIRITRVMEPLTPSSPGSTRLFSSQNPASSAPVIPSVNYFSIDPNSNSLQFGDLELIASQQKSPIEYTDVSKLGTSEGPAVGTKVWIRGRVNSVRAKGNVCFLVLRSKAFYTIQACHFKDKQSPEESKSLIKYVSALSAESIVDIYGEITAADVKACSQNNVEIQIKKIFTVSRAPSVLPFLLEDAGRSQKEIDESQSTDRPYSGVNQVSLSFQYFISSIPYIWYLFIF